MAQTITVPRVLVARLGAMNHYLTPVSLARQGMLEHFYTDIYLGSERVRRMIRLLASRGRFAGLRRLLGRSAAELPDSLVTGFPAFGLWYTWRRRQARGWSAQLDLHRWGGRRFCELILDRDRGQANTVYAYSSAALELLCAARNRGQLAVLDHITAPLVAEQQLVAAEHERYPGWAPAWPLDDSTREFARRQREECDAADLIVCLSSFAQQVLAGQGVAVEKMVVIPPALLDGPTADRPTNDDSDQLRVLFVGNDPMRKGLPDLVQAASLLDRRRFHFRAVGVSDLSAHGLHEAQRWVEVVGSVPRTEMARQYLESHVLAFPTVSETFGIVILEAMRAGMVVITTPNGGGPDVIRDGVDGCLVPIHSPEAIAEKLELLARDRRLREEMGRSARRRAAEFTVERYSQQLAGALRGAKLPRQGAAVRT